MVLKVTDDVSEANHSEPATEDDFSAVDLAVEIETALQNLRRRQR